MLNKLSLQVIIYLKPVLNWKKVSLEKRYYGHTNKLFKLTFDLKLL